MSAKLKGFVDRYLLKPVLDQIKQGADARSLATAVAAGVTIAILPILGITTAVCVMVGVRWRLNQPILQLVNYLFYPMQILLIPVFILLGAKLLGVEPVSFHPETVIQEFKTDPFLFMSNYGVAGLRGVLVWVLSIPLVFFPIRALSFQVFRRMMDKQGVIKK